MRSIAFCFVLMSLCFVPCAFLPSVLAHHGGLGVEGDLVQWALKVDQWQDEVSDQDYRIKFLSYPRQPVVGNPTRLVFEIQSITTGQYVGGLAAEVEVQPPDSLPHTVPLPETTGVVAYYEVSLVFEQAGEHLITFHAVEQDVAFSGTFRKGVSRSSLFGDWSTLVGNTAVLAAFAMTWLGFVLSVQRRFIALKPGA
jgi:hypothetical protein